MPNSISRRGFLSAVAALLVAVPVPALARGGACLIVDPAQYGSWSTSYSFRNARGDYTLLELVVGEDTVEIVRRAVAWFEASCANHFTVNSVGLGAGVADQLRRYGYPVHEMNLRHEPYHG